MKSIFYKKIYAMFPELNAVVKLTYCEVTFFLDSQHDCLH